MANYNPKVFLQKLAREVPRLMPQELAGLRAEPRGRLLKLWYGEEQEIHYEVWMHEQTQQLELGLHCEAAPEVNEAVRAGLAAELFEIKHRLGPRVEVEPWDRGWTRIYETHPLYPLDDPRLEELAGRCSFFISQLQPLYEAIAGELPYHLGRLNISHRVSAPRTT